MTLLDINLDNIPERKLPSEGEHKLRVETVIEQLEAANPRLAMGLRSLTETGSEMAWLTLWMPNGEDENRDIESQRRILDFVTAFQVPVGKKGLDTESMVGCTGWGKVVHRTREDTGEDVANVTKILVGK